MWFLFSFLTAFFESLKDVFSKRGLKKDIDEYVVAWSLKFFAVLALIPLTFFSSIPLLGPRLWPALFAGGTLNVIAAILFMKALKHSDLSLTIPMITFTPLFLLATSPLMIGEWPKPLGLAGVLLVVLGSYVLNIKERHAGFFAPFKALVREKGPRLMLIVAFIWSITSNFDKIGVKNSSPLFWVLAMNVYMALVLLPIVLYKSRQGVKVVVANWKSLLPVGLFNATAQIFQMTAVSLTLVAYVISVKRTSVIFGVIFGALLFKEKGLKERLVGAAIMVAGVALIMFSK